MQLKRSASFAVVLLGLGILAVAGCESVPLGATFQPLPAVPPGQAAVYLYRPSLSFEYGVVFDVHANGAPLIGLADGSYWTYLAAPGLVTFTSKRGGERTAELPINLEAGKSYYVQLIPERGIFRCRPVLMLFHEDDAKRDIIGCRRILK